MKEITRNNVTFKVDGPNADFFDHYVNQTWEPETFSILEKFLTKEMTYLDLGAWMGVTVIPASFSAKTCYAVEPDPTAYEELVGNLSLNGFSNILPFRVAITDYNGSIELGNPSRLGNSSTRRYQTLNTFTTPCFTLTEFCEQNVMGKVGFVKIDVEGSEELIFRDLDFFANHRPIVYLNLHSFWFQDLGRAGEDLARIGKLYSQCYDNRLNKAAADFSTGTLLLIP